MYEYADGPQQSAEEAAKLVDASSDGRTYTYENDIEPTNTL